ncbi:molybdopterin-dependent oxidoreductase [Geobacter sp. DSM 9736]|uniref:molybdopterin-containing oxidoreductase family protein n=1 Tax=Geobacter sp. DSM 9736 TaxID=1277350 RepID=UPI000B503D39|nr:molybdopterin-dependent oxidoreductase [Geobacter sp. DSM 9736]SNB44817.1 thiosulfate reductase / polysulfide reductase chain A [Geobacter sp. DSM 9736]
MPRFTRRSFLKISGAASIGLTAAKVPQTVLSWAEETGNEELKKVPTFCELCFWNCGLVAKVENGKVIKVDGNPLSERGRGRLCGRGNAALGSLYDPDRLKFPLINTGKRGEPRWKRASWDEALGVVAGKLQAIREKYGPEAVALFSHGTGGAFWKHLLKAYGSPYYTAPSFAQCRGPRDVGFTMTFGTELGSPEFYDFSESRYIVLLGCHLGENAHNSQVQDLIHGLNKGAKLCVVDPRLSNIAGKADHWLPIRPATDLALLLAWIRVIVNEELYDAEYLKAYAMGLPELKAAVQDYTPEWAEKETDIPAATIVNVARELAAHKPNVIISGGRFSAWYGDDAQRSRAVALLNALLGSWGRPGGIYLPASGKVPEYPGLPEYPEHREDLPALDGAYPFALSQTTTSIRTAAITGEPHPIKGWLVYGCNLMKTMPDTAETIKAINNLDLLVAIDILPADIVKWADVVLPECTYLERHDTLSLGKFKEFEVAIRQPAIDPMWESKPSWWITKELGKKMGLEAYFPWKDGEEYLAKRCEAAGISYAELKEKGVVKVPGTSAPYITPLNQPTFETPSGKIELHSAQLAEKGFDPVPRYTQHEQAPSGFFRVLFGRSPLHTFSRTTNNFMLTDLTPENSVWVSAVKGKELGLRDGDYVRLENQAGYKSPGRIKVRLTQRLRPDCVYMVHGFGVRSKGMTRADNKGIGDEEMLAKYTIDPLMGGTGMRSNFVKIVKEG